MVNFSNKFAKIDYRVYNVSMTTKKEGYQSPDGRKVLGRLKDKFQSINLERKLRGQNARMRAEFMANLDKAGNLDNTLRTHSRLFLSELSVDQVLKTVRDEQWIVGEVKAFDYGNLIGAKLVHSFNDVGSSTTSYKTPNYRRIYSRLPPVLADILDGPPDFYGSVTRYFIERKELQLIVGFSMGINKDASGNWNSSFFLSVTNGYPMPVHHPELILGTQLIDRPKIMPYNASLMDGAFDFLVNKILSFADVSAQSLEREASERVKDFREETPGSKNSQN